MATTAQIRTLPAPQTPDDVVRFLDEASAEAKAEPFECAIVILVRADGSTEHWRAYPEKQLGAVLGALELTKLDCFRSALGG